MVKSSCSHGAYSRVENEKRQPGIGASTDHTDVRPGEETVALAINSTK